ncbi:DUF6440 family protein [Bacillus sp. NPDC094106]|uniref:DUF6440 family protein n=1 Tax=Bacillus sp. NPDC094106 TaxID=3363949 RepID=UPI00380D0A0A
MKKLLLILSLILVVGCEKEEHPEEIKKTSVENIKVFVDKETGCEYLYRDKTHGYAGVGGMTIRLDENGKPKGCRKISQ